jgi:hypothetical protein
MNETLRAFLANIAVILLVVTFIGTAFVYIKGSAYKGTIEALEKNVSALKDQVNILSGDIEVLKKRELRYIKRIDTLRNENTSLKSYRPSNEVLASIVSTLKAHHAELIALIKKEK